jgi:tetratricopeptide (TPR) repeat protein
VVLVTSRRRLAGLDPTHTVSLSTLPTADAVALLRQTAGEGRLAGQPPEVLAELVGLCGGLPLAIRIAAARLRSHPAWDLRHLVQRLRDQQRRLVELAAGQRSVTAALDLSYQELTADLQRGYRLLGLHPASDIDPYASAALFDTTLSEADTVLEELYEAHLLQEPIPGRYRFHDLTRMHAAHTAARDEAEQCGHAALDRLLDFYRHCASTAMDTAHPYDRERRPRVPSANTPSPELSDPAAALNWLDHELPNLLTVASYAGVHDRPAHLLHLSTILHRHLRTRGHHDDAVALHQQALTTAHATANHAAELEALVCLGHTDRMLGRYDRATEHFQQALQLARTIGDCAGELNALIGLGDFHRLRGRYEPAIDHYRQALELARAIGHRAGELDALAGLGDTHRLLGRYELATDNLEQALRLARTIGYRPGELNALACLGVVDRWLGRHGQAIVRYQEALQLARATGNRNAEQAALTGLGLSHRMQGEHRQAADYYQRLLDLSHHSGNRNWQYEAWQGLGRLQTATGHPDAALNHHQQAHDLATELGQPDDQARAHDGLAYAHLALQEHQRARAHWQQALDILVRLGVDHTEDEETTVAAIGGHLLDLNRRAGFRRASTDR